MLINDALKGNGRHQMVPEARRRPVNPLPMASNDLAGQDLAGVN